MTKKEPSLMKSFWKKAESLKQSYQPKSVPKVLYHGTTDVIFREHLKNGWKPDERHRCLFTTHEKFIAEEYAKNEAERRNEKPVVVEIKDLSPKNILRFDDDYDIRYRIGYAPSDRNYVTTYNICKPISKSKIQKTKSALTNEEK